MRPLTAVFVLFMLIPALASAHGPSRQKVVSEVTINASPEKVWDMISGFCSISRWNPGVTACVADSEDKPETIRTITLQNGQTLDEKLVKHQPENMRIQYMLVKANVDALPINTLGSMLTVRAAGDGSTVVEYKGAFYRSFPGPNPPPELSDAAATKAVTDLYETGLAGLKTLAEQ